MTKPYAIGIDIGGTTTKLGLADRKGNLTHQSGIPTTGHSSLDDYISALATEATKIIDEVEVENVCGVGIGAPNGNYYTGEIVDAANLEWKGHIPIAKLIETKLGLHVTLTNDANATAMGEMMYGAAIGMNDFIMITLGTGVGSGIVANGKLIYGHDGFAGELGHVIAVRGGRHCGCGRKGCMERYCSATGIVITAREFLSGSNIDSMLKEQGDRLTAKNIHDAALSGDKVALNVFDYTAQILGQSLADAVAVTSPQAIILFGGLAKAGDILLQPTKKYMEENMLSIYKDKVKLLPSALPDTDAAILGASALAW